MMGWLHPDRAGFEGLRRYRAVQCGLCHELGARHGLLARLGAGPDLVAYQVFLEVVSGEVAPMGARPCVVSLTRRPLPVRLPGPATTLAADFGIWMAREKALDDWRDERSLLGGLAAAFLREAAGRAQARLTEAGFPVRAILASLREQSALERRTSVPLEEASAATCQIGRLAFGFAANDRPSRRAAAEQVGEALASWLFWVDGLMDWERDLAKGRYNPLARSLAGPPPARPSPPLRARALSEAHGALDRLAEGLRLLRADGADPAGLDWLRAVLVDGPRGGLQRLSVLGPLRPMTARDLRPPRPSPRLRILSAVAGLRARLARHPQRRRLQLALAFALAWLFPARSWGAEWWPEDPAPPDTGWALDTGAALDTGLSTRTTGADEGTPTLWDGCFNGCGFCDIETCCDSTCGQACEGTDIDCCGTSSNLNGGA